MSKDQTDNSYLEAKISLRIRHLPTKKKLRVLDCFHGTGLIWDIIRRHFPKREILVLGIDIDRNKPGVYLVGDNKKFLMTMNLSAFDVFDLDAYGVPCDQVEAILSNPTFCQGRFFVTMIQSGFGCLPNKMLHRLGYTAAMIRKCPALFNRDGYDKFLSWLGLHGVKQVIIVQDPAQKKNYLTFTVSKSRKAKKKHKKQ